MFTSRWRLFRLVGIPISVDASWLIIVALLTYTFANDYLAFFASSFPDYPLNLTPSQRWVAGLTAAIAFFVCILLHELGHAIVARARGMRIGGITLFLFGGVAEITDEPPSPLTEFLMAIAGPAVSLVLAILFSILTGLGGRRRLAGGDRPRLLHPRHRQQRGTHLQPHPRLPP